MLDSFLQTFYNPWIAPLAAALVALLTVLLLGPAVIAALRARKIGDNPEFDQADINTLMKDKRGTPTMGGLLIVLAIVVSVSICGAMSNPLLRLGLLVLLILGSLGVVDDWSKLNKHRRARSGEKVDRQGLGSKSKLIVQLSLGAAVGWIVLRGLGPTVLGIRWPFSDHVSLVSPWMFIALSAVVIAGASNTVNLTDGLDGLSAGCVAIACCVFLIVAVSGNSDIRPLAVLPAAMIGACLGFLWFNAFPARVFMGDTGSLALGGLLGYVAIVLRAELLLAIVGLVFVAEGVSVMLQVGYFKLTRKLTGTGRRIFLMSPLHHHFQKKGWPEMHVVIRFWIAAAVLALVGLASVR